MTARDLVQRYHGDLQKNPKMQAVCVIENINPDYIDVLGSAWDIDPEFFARHAFNPELDNFWISQMLDALYLTDDWPRWGHLDGIFEYHGLKLNDQKAHSTFPNTLHRTCVSTTQDRADVGVSSNTRISSYRVGEGLCKYIPLTLRAAADPDTQDLVLVDAPLGIQKGYNGTNRRHRATLRCPYARNTGGLLLPRLLDQEDITVEYSMIETIGSAFQHKWQRDLLFSNPDHHGVFPGVALLYLLASSNWQRSLQHLSSTIRMISFQHIRDPSPEINDKLHDLREDLETLRLGIKETLDCMPDPVERFFGYGNSDAGQPLPPSRCRRMLAEAEDLSRFLMDTFTLLLSSTSVQEAKMSRDETINSSKQALRATQLTLLASIYVPLSFVTGVFGMNLKEVNGSQLSVWVFFVALAIAAIVTAAIFWAIHRHSKRKL